MRLVPQDADQTWIVEHLAELIAERGAATFLRGPIVEPTSAFFPDPWHADDASVTRLLRRILGLAGLKDLAFDLEIVDGEEHALDESWRGAGHESFEAAAWFAGLDEDGTAHFGVDRAELEDSEGLAAILCHEVAHAWRARWDLTYFDDVEDELLTDLSTVFLGFGILTANVTHRYRRRVEHAETSMGGYLSPVAMSFALAVQAVARHVPKAEAQRLGRLLEPAQEGCFLESVRVLGKDRTKLLGDLGIGEKLERPIGQTVYRVRRGWFRKPICSGMDCGVVLLAESTHCSRCGGVVRGDVGSLEEAAALEGELAGDLGKDILAGLGKTKRAKE